MTTEQTFTEILERLAAIEKRLDDLPTGTEIGEIVATTASHGDVSDLQDTLDYIADQFGEQEKKRALAEIRQSYRGRAAS